MEKKINIILSSGIALLTLLSIIFFWKENIVLLSTLSILALLLLLINADRREVETFIICIIIGSIVTAVIMMSKRWSYGNSTFSEIPFWLATFWGIAGIYTSRLRSKNKKVKIKKDILEAVS